MPSAKLWLCCGLLAIGISACGSSARPPAGSPAALAGHGLRGKVDDPRPAHFQCLLQHHLPAVEVSATTIQVGPPGVGPAIYFRPTPGAAQADQIEGVAQGAEVIGSALLFPNHAPDSELQVVEDCVAQDVSG